MLKKSLDKSKINKDNPFIEIQRKYFAWLKEKPTGKFILEITINQGGIQGRPKTIISELLK